ncbi:MAG: hypothetical protein NUV72_08515 [Bauldia sp.]|nr:hypothetical protein [Bauldia sp.]
MASRLDEILRRRLEAAGNSLTEVESEAEGTAAGGAVSFDGTSQERFAQLLLKLRVPRKYQGVLRSTELDRKLAGWTGDPWCVTFVGKAGRGKTWQAVRLLAAVFESDPRRFTWSKYRSFFVDWSTAIEQIKREFGTDERGVTFDELCHAEILLIDDFGAERETAFSMDQASLILRARYNEQRPTILTTNFPSLEPVAAAEPRIASRLAEGIVLSIEGRDRRLPASPRPEAVR